MACILSGDVHQALASEAANLLHCTYSYDSHCKASSSSLWQVWEPESEGQVLRVAPFAPHRPVIPGQNHVNHPLQPRAMEEEMGLVKDRLTAVRAHLHKPIKELLTPSVQHFLRNAQPLDTVRTGRHVFPSIPSVPELLKVLVFLSAQSVLPCVSLELITLGAFELSMYSYIIGWYSSCVST